MPTRLKSRYQCPPNGFQFRQNETGWEAQTWDFHQLCRDLQNHRRANPKFKLTLDLAAIEAEVEAANVSRVSQIPGADIYLTQGDIPPPKFQAPASQVKRLAAGAVTLVDWIKSGEEAVSKELSTARASVCAALKDGKPCPKNTSGDWTAFFTLPVSRAIRSELEKKRGWHLSTHYDEQLGVCSACLCPLQLKVHMGIAAILKRLPAESKSRLVPECWILSEERQQNDPPPASNPVVS